MKTTGQLTELLAGALLLWSGSLSFISDIRGVHVRGLSSQKSGRFPTVHMVLPWALLPTGMAPYFTCLESSITVPLG
jgi:hypothetical protein